jgi:hypothetical protein
MCSGIRLSANGAVIDDQRHLNHRRDHDDAARGVRDRQREPRVGVRGNPRLDEHRTVPFGAHAQVEAVAFAQLGDPRGHPAVVEANVFGWLQCMGGVELAHDLVAAPGTRLMACSTETMLDLLEDDIPLASRLLQLPTVRGGHASG